MRLRTRGQAAVELALGLTVMVTVLLFGVHFGEMGYLGAKVHEAAASTMWDATAYQTHRLNGYFNSNLIAIPKANGMSSRYADYDGRASHAGAAPVMATVRTEVITTRCVQAGGYALSPLGPFGEPGGISCMAGSSVSVVNIGNNFLNDAHGFFGESQVHRVTTNLCSTGRLTAGVCGQIPMMLGDDALHDGTEQLECQLQTSGGTPCGNPDFYGSVQTSFNKSAIAGGLGNGYTGYPESWASNIVDDVPGGQLTGFYMSFRGNESNYTEGNIADGEQWQTNPMDAPLPAGTPYRFTAWTDRNACAAGGFCYLGRYACN